MARVTGMPAVGEHLDLVDDHAVRALPGVGAGQHRDAGPVGPRDRRRLGIENRAHPGERLVGESHCRGELTGRMRAAGKQRGHPRDTPLPHRGKVRVGDRPAVLDRIDSRGDPGVDGFRAGAMDRHPAASRVHPFGRGREHIRGPVGDEPPARAEVVSDDLRPAAGPPRLLFGRRRQLGGGHLARQAREVTVWRCQEPAGRDDPRPPVFPGQPRRRVIRRAGLEDSQHPEREFDRRAGPDPDVGVLVVARGAGQAEMVVDVDQAGQHPACRVGLGPPDRGGVGDHAVRDDQIPLLVVVFDHACANGQVLHPLHEPVSTAVACDPACDGDGRTATRLA
jgi:hypothetical protein